MWRWVRFPLPILSKFSFISVSDWTLSVKRSTSKKTTKEKQALKKKQERKEEKEEGGGDGEKEGVEEKKCLSSCDWYVQA